MVNVFSSRETSSTTVPALSDTALRSAFNIADLVRVTSSAVAIAAPSRRSRAKRFMARVWLSSSRVQGGRCAEKVNVRALRFTRGGFRFRSADGQVAAGGWLQHGVPGVLRDARADALRRLPDRGVARLGEDHVEA